ncbi:hypothetical protein [Clostridium beijerinckii]|uniref:hypothetical protein n=1 Tax=Clostridium beijerinckii TaxID=1520 RepID=UPI0015707516|nr:hypothetical protein [Clostridium beijerinckii]NRT73710.1 hypothetical protein [Clostridium beijerinckii]
MELKRIIDKNIEKASKGRQIWIKILEKYGIGDGDYIILMPSLNNEYNYYTLLHLNEFINKVNAKRIILLTHDSVVKKVAKLFSNKIYDILYFSREDAECVMKFYCLYKFTDSLIIASLDEPEGRNGKSLIGKNGITLEEVIAIGVYGLKEYKRIIPPFYEGYDKEVKKFLTLGN